MLDDFACQFYIIENETKKEKERRKGKRNRIKKKRDRLEKRSEEKYRRAKRDENHMLNECACRLYAQLEIRLQVQTNARDGYEEERKISHTHVNISRNENAEVKSISEET